MVGIDSGDTAFDTLNETGGSADATVVSHTHTATSTVTDPGHEHEIMQELQGAFANNGAFIQPASSQISNDFTNNSASATTGISVSTSIASAGSSGTDANLQPYIVVYMWKRTA